MSDTTTEAPAVTVTPWLALAAELEAKAGAALEDADPAREGSWFRALGFAAAARHAAARARDLAAADGTALVPAGELAAFGKAMERAEATIRRLEAEVTSLRNARADERARVRDAVSRLKTVLVQPNGYPVDAVPFALLLGVLSGGGPE